MTQEEENTLHLFETRIRQLIFKYRELEAENQQLTELIGQKDQAFKKLMAENDQLRNDYARLKISKMMEISNKDLGEAKNRVAKLIREVDKCIALLNI